ncbi:hypothetical protein [Kribbella deserti]|uniref:Uncharacterized protein n=1 Tax=Kribbella deserti TaxID=1926257 RepID=A0ABV6QH01_9ACTN
MAAYDAKQTSGTPDPGGSMFEFIFALVVVAVAIVGNAMKASTKKKQAAAAPWARIQHDAQRLRNMVTPQPMPPAMQPAPIQAYNFPVPGPGQYQAGPQQYGPPPQHFQPGPPQYQGQPQPYQPGPMPFQTAPGQQPVHRVPANQGSLDDRVRRMMGAGNEVGAVRLLCDEADLGIIEAQRYARSLVQPATDGQEADSGGTDDAERRTAEDAETRYVGSAAIATSTFDLGQDDGWASGWTDTAEPEDRSDMNELWETVRQAGRPGAGRTSGSGGDNSTFDSEMDLD